MGTVYNGSRQFTAKTPPVSGHDPSVPRLLADDPVHLAVDPGGEGQLHGARAEPRDAAAAVGAPAAERALLCGVFEPWLPSKY